MTGGRPREPEDRLPPAVNAFEKTADRFDERFGDWLSVAAQRRLVRERLVRAFPPGARLLELGAGTAEDALYLLGRGYDVTLTDGSPSMVARATRKLAEAGYGSGTRPEQLVLERMAEYAAEHARQGRLPFDGAYSNFAAFNCVEDRADVACHLAKVLRPGAPCILVVFGPCSPGEVLVELAKGRPRAAFRRFRAGPAPARLGGERFQVWYPSPRTLAREFAPWFRLVRTLGIGIFLPPSAAEPRISSFPKVVRAMEAADRMVSRPLALLGDHVLLHFERTAEDAGSPEVVR